MDKTTIIFRDLDTLTFGEVIHHFAKKFKIDWIYFNPEILLWQPETRPFNNSMIMILIWLFNAREKKDKTLFHQNKECRDRINELQEIMDISFNSIWQIGKEQDLKQSFLDFGRNPEYHKKQLLQLQRSRPVLFNAVVDFLSDKEKERLYKNVPVLNPQRKS